MTITVGEFISIGMALFAILGLIITYVTKIAKMENTLSAFGNIAREVQELTTKVTLLWDIDISDSLKRQRAAGVVISASPDIINPVWTERYKSVIDSTIHERLKHEILKLGECGMVPSTDADLAVWVVGSLGLDLVSKRADVLESTIQEYLARQIVWIKLWLRERDTIDGGERLEPLIDYPISDG